MQRKGHKGPRWCCGNAANWSCLAHVHIRRLTYALSRVPESLRTLQRFKAPPPASGDRRGESPRPLLQPGPGEGEPCTLAGPFVRLLSLPGTLCRPSFHITSLSVSTSLSLSCASLCLFQLLFPSCVHFS